TAAPAGACAPSSTSQASPVRTKLATDLRRRVASRSICPTTSRSSLRTAPPFHWITLPVHPTGLPSRRPAVTVEITQLGYPIEKMGRWYLATHAAQERRS